MTWFVAGFVVGVATIAILRPWLRGVMAGVSLPLGYVVGMSFRGSPAKLLVDAHVALAKRGHPVGFDQVEAAYLAHRSNVRSEQDLVTIVQRDVPPETDT